MNLSVLGPNLFGHPWATFVVHEVSCDDIGRDCARYGGDIPWTAEFGSQDEVVDDVYEWLGGDNSEDGDPMYPSARGYGQEFDFKPCTKHLPKSLTRPTNHETMHLELMLEKETKRYGNYLD